MKFAPIAAALLGLAGIAALVAWFGAGAVLHSLEAVGWTGFAAIVLIQLALIALMGVAWHALIPDTPLWASLWGRLIRDAGSEVLPLSQVGGYVLGVRALALAGISGAVAAASTIVDVTLEFVAQLAFTLIGLLYLLYLRQDPGVAWPVAIGLGIGISAAAVFVVLQRRGIGVPERLARTIGRGWADRLTANASALGEAITRIHHRHLGLWLSALLHLVCWIASAAEIWIALRLAGQPLDFGVVLVIESLLYAIRSVAFAIPNAVGVQEGAYILLGAGFGLGPDMALALSLLKRARDFAIGLPALGVWQALESSRLLTRLHSPDRAAPTSSSLTIEGALDAGDRG